MIAAVNLMALVGIVKALRALRRGQIDEGQLEDRLLAGAG